MHFGVIDCLHPKKWEGTGVAPGNLKDATFVGLDDPPLQCPVVVRTPDLSIQALLHFRPHQLRHEVLPGEVEKPLEEDTFLEHTQHALAEKTAGDIHTLCWEEDT